MASAAVLPKEQNNLDPRFVNALGILWRGGKHATFWKKRPGGHDTEKYTVWVNTDEPIEHDLSEWVKWNNYFSVNPTDTRRGVKQRVRKLDVSAVNCLYAEFDVGPDDEFKTLQDALDHINSLPEPSMIIFSGGGFHCYWFFDETYCINSEEQRNHIDEIQKAWVKFAGGDESAKDLDRVLRIPGTTNWKDDYKPNYPTVELLVYKPNQRYSIDLFEDLTDELRKQDKERIERHKEAFTRLGSVDTGAFGRSWDEVWEVMKGDHCFHEIQRLWDGDLSVYDNDHSRCDYHLCRHLARYLGPDPQAIENAFNASGLYREKKWAGRPKYRESTITKAINAVGEFWKWDWWEGKQAKEDSAKATGGIVKLLDKKKEMEAKQKEESSKVEVQTDAEENEDSGTVEDAQEQQNSKPESQTKKNQAAILFNLAYERIELLSDRTGKGYAFVREKDCRPCYMMRSAAFRGWLKSLFFDELGSIPGSQTAEDAIDMLEYKSKDFPQDVFVRVGEKDGRIYIDLANEKWNAIEVDSKGWRVVDQAPVAFRRIRGMLPLPEPTQDGHAEDLAEHINIHLSDWPLVAAWIVAAMRPDGPYPILVLVGEAGTAKTSTVEKAKRIIDPNETKTRSEPRTVEDVMIGADNSWILAYDNVSYISNAVSDALCRVATGGGYTAREFYTNGDEYTINVQRPIVMNGITDFVTRDDLMSRSIVLDLPVISSDKRQSAAEMNAKFEKDHPKLLGAFLDILADTLHALPNVSLESLPRMADFAKLATAAELAIGLCPGDFVKLYDENREESTSTIVENSPITEPIRELLRIDGEFKGTATELLKKLQEKAGSERWDDEWPKSHNSLSRKLNQLAPSLRESKIANAHKARRTWTITKIQQE